MRLNSARRSSGKNSKRWLCGSGMSLVPGNSSCFRKNLQPTEDPVETTLDTEKRRYPRFECTGTGGVHIASSEPPCCAKIVDLSVEGCLMVLLQPVSIPQDSMVELTFNVNWLPFRVRALVKVIRSATTIGFQFHQVSKRTQRYLADLIEELAEPRPRDADDTRVRSYNGR